MGSFVYGKRPGAFYIRRKEGINLHNEKTRFQLLLERVASDPELKQQVLNATPEQFLALCKSKGLERLDMDKAEELLKKVKAAFDSVSGELSPEQLTNAAGGVGVCIWNCYCQSGYC